MSFIQNNHGEIKIDKQMNITMQQPSATEPAAEPQPQSEWQSPIHLNHARGFKIDLIRVINVLYLLGFFTDANGAKVTKKELFTTIGHALNVDLQNYDNDLSRSLSDSTALEKHLSIFARMKKKMEEVFNSYGG